MKNQPFFDRQDGLMTPGILEAGHSLKRLLQGAAAGALIAAIIGLTWGGWTLGTAAEKVARERVESAQFEIAPAGLSPQSTADSE
jgi:hypothetical protein